MVCQDQWCGIDSETELIQNRHSWPDVVVAGFCSRGHCQLVWWTDLPVYLPQFLALNPYTTLVFLNLAFDFNVMGRSILLEELKKDNRVIELQANYRMSRMAEKGSMLMTYTHSKSVISRSLQRVISDEEESELLEA